MVQLIEKDDKKVEAKVSLLQKFWNTLIELKKQKLKVNVFHINKCSSNNFSVIKTLFYLGKSSFASKLANILTFTVTVLSDKLFF